MSEGITIHFHENVITSGDCSNGVVAEVSLEWLSKDVCGNTTLETVLAHIVDTTGPVLVNFNPVLTIGCHDSIPEITATDNCGKVTLTVQESIVPGSCEFKYDVRRMIVATDPCGNTTTETQTIHVGDSSGPIIEGVVEEVCDDLSIPDDSMGSLRRRICRGYDD